jgi:regulatory protein
MGDKSEKEELLQRAMRECSVREYCISDISSLLGRWGVLDAEIKEWVINRLITEKFIDEHRYSRAFVVDHFRHSHWGKVKITMGLRSKRVDPAAIDSGLEAIDDGEYHALLMKILEEHRKKIRAKNRLDLKGKLLRHALGKGFESHLVYDAVNAICKD